MRKSSDVVIKNRKASFDYEFIDRYVAGICLCGTEIKSLREGKTSLVDTFCMFINGELWVRNLYIAEYKFGSWQNHQERRDRKLLLTRKELRKLEKGVETSGFAIVPIKMFINEKGFAKIEIALARGKKEFDKRQTIRERDDKRNLDRIKRVYAQR